MLNILKSVYAYFPMGDMRMKLGPQVLKKNFETEFRVNGHKLLLNHFVQETVANILVGFLKTLKDLDDLPTEIEIHIKRLPKQKEVDAHIYP